MFLSMDGRNQFQAHYTSVANNPEVRTDTYQIWLQASNTVALLLGVLDLFFKLDAFRLVLSFVNQLSLD